MNDDYRNFLQNLVNFTFTKFCVIKMYISIIYFDFICITATLINDNSKY